MGKKTIRLSASERRKLYAAREDFVVSLHDQITTAGNTHGEPKLVGHFMRQVGMWLYAVKYGNERNAASLFPQLFKTATELQTAITNGEVVLISKGVADA